MARWKMRYLLWWSLIAVCGCLSVSIAEVPQAFKSQTDAIIDTLRKGNDTVRVVGTNPIAGAQVSVKQLRHSFGFGTALTLKGFNADSAKYAQSFLKYFEIATPENEMKWVYNNYSDSCVEPCPDPDYSQADELIEWCKLHKVPVRGHNLFWNEKPDWIPGCTRCMQPAAFKAEMTKRINDAMPHFKGKVFQWDIINEIIHGPNGSTPDQGMLEKMSGDNNIFTWVIKEAKKLDSTVKMVVNDYNIIEKYSNADKYIAKINSLTSSGAKIDIVGCEGHFSRDMVQSDYKQKIDQVATGTGLPIWLTEVDFEIDAGKEDSLEKLMRTVFADPYVEGLVMWMFWEGDRWRATYTSFFVDSSFDEVSLGVRWRQLKDSWTTKDTSGTTDANGQFIFKGFYGTYEVKVNNNNITHIDTVDFPPKSPGKFTTKAVFHSQGAFEDMILVLNGRNVAMKLPRTEIKRIFISTYSLSGKLLSKTPLALYNDLSSRCTPSTGCYIYRIGTDKEVLHTAMGLNLR